ncbi:MAG: hypothetical protein DRQ41_12015, partial [Gammaproteobacteria bacterium]
GILLTGNFWTFFFNCWWAKKDLPTLHKNLHKNPNFSLHKNPNFSRLKYMLILPNNKKLVK